MSALTLSDALTLAHRDRDGHPLNPLKNPPPTPAEAVPILENSLKRCGFNWLTGRAALDLCKQTTKRKGSASRRAP